MVKNKLILLGFIVFLAVLCIGCGDPNMGYVTGKVWIDDKPAEKGLIVRFQPQASGSSPSSGVTDNNGKYEMHFSITKKGVQTGLCKIIVEYPEEDGLPKTPEFLKTFNNSPPVYKVKSGYQTYDINIDNKSNNNK
ncbi:MAG: hypothetical protein LBL62_02235 [Planctomycetaceae bacterium]|jgi:hypothetical protein|nr:hypothetical protein [Planctomycetaceae bacterium]